MAVLTERDEIALALAEYGLKEEWIADAIRRGERWRNATTPHHPRTAPGWYAWSETTTALRDVVVPEGGEATSVESFERLVCPTKRHEIAVLGGDRFTGDPLRDPQPKYMKPRVVAQGTIARSQIEMFREDIPTPPGRRVLLFLLVRRDGDNAVAELSRPGGITDSGRINVWEQRILLAPIPVGSKPLQDREDETEPVDIDVVPLGE
jgi:hypothetical protein